MTKKVLVGASEEVNLVIGSVDIETFNVGDLQIEIDSTVRRVFFSVTDKTKNSFEWDPSVGITDGQTPSSATLLLPSFFLLAVALLAKFL